MSSPKINYEPKTISEFLQIAKVAVGIRRRVRQGQTG